MRAVRSCVWTAAAVAIGFVVSASAARYGEPDPARSRDVEAIERVGGYVTRGGC